MLTMNQDMPANMKQIAQAQIDYNNNSSPHTYTGDLARLVSGEGAGGSNFWIRILLTGLSVGIKL